MRHATPALACLGALLLTSACGSEAGGGAAADVTLAEQSDATIALGGGGGEADAGPARGLQDTAPPTTLGGDCQGDGDCQAGEVCYRGICAAGCAAPADCPSGQDCSADGAGRQVCVKPAYHAAVGQACGATGQCPEGTTCIGVPYSAFATCSAACNDDTDCPMAMFCGLAQGQKLCQTRRFCSPCGHDGHCDGGRCLELGGVRACARGCTAGSSECPRYASCQDVGGGDFQCVHKAGACVGDGGLCAACTGEGQCAGDAPCLTYIHTKESFCATACTTSCPSGYKCTAVSGSNRCVPADQKNPKCVAEIASKMMDVGDVMDDYAMVGFVDTDDDGLLTNEEPRIVRMSDYAEHHELILLNVAAVWCSACQAETGDMRSLYKIYYPKGLVLMQTLYDGQKPGDPMTMGLLKAWNKQLKPAGAVGMDPERWVAQYNTGGSTPLNVLIDAKTRKVLYKVNGYNRYTIEGQIKKALKDKGL